MGKRRHGSRQDVLLLTETGDIADLKLETEGGYIADPDNIDAWEQDLNQQCRDENNGNLCQVISERSKTPLKIFRNKPVLEGQSTDVIASRKQDEELAFMNSRKEKNRMFIWVAIIAVLFAVVISIVVLLQLKNSNNQAAAISLPIAAIIPGILGKNGKKQPDIDSGDGLKKLIEKESCLVDCIVISENTGLKTYRRLNTSLIPNDAIERKYKNKPAYILGLDKGGLWAIEPDNKVEIGQSPKDCFIALQYEQEVNECFGMSEGFIEKMKVGILIFLCIFELVILFLIITAATGGG